MIAATKNPDDGGDAVDSVSVLGVALVPRSASSLATGFVVSIPDSSIATNVYAPFAANVIDGFASLATLGFFRYVHIRGFPEKLPELCSNVKPVGATDTDVSLYAVATKYSTLPTAVAPGHVTVPPVPDAALVTADCTTAGTLYTVASGRSIELFALSDADPPNRRDGAFTSPVGST